MTDASAISIPAAAPMTSPAPQRAVTRAWDARAALRYLGFELTVLLVLIGSTIAGFWQIALTGRILVGYDLFSYFYPYREAVDRAFREGRIALWNPDIFLGVPLLANIQSAVFYPMSWLTIGLPATQAVTVQILLHVLLAGVGMYAFCRLSVGLDRIAAVLGALVFMFSGFISGQVGHPNQLSASAWLPIILVLYEQACRRKQYPLVFLTAVAIAVQALAGHTQEWYLTMVALGAFFALQLIAGTQRALILGVPSPYGLRNHLKLTAKMVGFWIGELSFTTIAFGLVIVLGIGLAAFQLVPTYELSAESIRSGGLPFREATSFSLRPWEILRTLLPGYLENPFSEFIGYIGILPLALGLVAIGVRFRSPYTWFFVGLAAVSLFMAFGNFNPFYNYAFRFVPGLNLFRVPARWLFLYTFSAASLAAVGASVFSGPAKSTIGYLRRSQLGIILVVIAVFVALWLVHPLLTFPRREVLALWVPMIGLALAMILGGLPWAPNRWLGVAIVIIAGVELYFARGDLDLSHPVSPGAYTSLRPAISQLLLDKDRFRVLTVSEGTFDPGDLADLKVVLRDELTPERIQEYVTAAKYNELLTPNVGMRYEIGTIDGYDGGILPLRRYVDFKNVILESGEGLAASVVPRQNNRQPDAILRDQLDALPDSALLGSMNVRYAIMDKSRDPWVSNVYYDLGTSLRVTKDQPVTLNNLPTLASTSIGLITYLEGAESVRSGDVVGTIRITDGTGRTVVDTLRAGYDTAEGDYNRPGITVQHAFPQRTIASLWKGNPQAYNYYSVIQLGTPSFPKSITFESNLSSGKLVIRGASLIDDRTSASASIVLNQHWELVLSGDLKVYKNLDWKDRAYLTRDVVIVANDKDALDVVRQTQGRTLAVTSFATPQEPPEFRTPLTDADKLKIVSDIPERREMSVNLTSPAYLVVSETNYPGWQASIDGETAPVLGANGLFMAVRVPAGAHTVVYEFRSGSFALGTLVSQTTAAVGLAVLALWLVLRYFIPQLFRSIRGVRRRRTSMEYSKLNS